MQQPVKTLNLFAVKKRCEKSRLLYHRQRVCNLFAHENALAF
jgi:hypothetical protein